MLEILRIALSSLGSVVALFILTKIIGNHQMSQLNMFDYINGITIGSIAAEFATSLENDYRKPLTAMIVYTLMSVLFSLLTNKSLKARRVLSGETLILYDNGKLYRKNFSKARLDIDEFLTECRSQGYFNLASIQTALIEQNGKISVLPLSTQRPVIPQDLNLTPEQERIVVHIIMDGQILKENLKYTGNNEDWLNQQLKAQGFSGADQIFLATCDSNNNLTVYKTVNKKQKRDPFV